MKKAILVAVISALTLGVNAGDWGKAPVPHKEVIEECVDIGGEVSVGYMSDYIFNGVRFARDSVWGDVNYTFDQLAVPITIGAWYLNGITGAPGYDELDLYASAELGTFAGFDTSIGYTHYFFPESGAGSYGEIGLDFARSLGIVDLLASANYALTSDRIADGTSGGWYFDLGIERSFALCDTVSLVLGAGVSYSDNYFNNYPGALLNIGAARDSGWNHYYVTASLPIELNCRATLTPYIGYNGSPDTWVTDGIGGLGTGEEQSDILHGGVSLTVSF